MTRLHRTRAIGMFVWCLTLLLSGCHGQAAPVTERVSPTLTVPIPSETMIQPTDTATIPPPPSNFHPEFIRANGTRLVTASSGKEIIFRGIDIGDYSQNGFVFVNRLKPEDYSTIASWGMNVVRLGLDYRLLMKDGTFQWDWLDQQVQWARQAGLYLILSMQVAPGLEKDPPDFWITPSDQEALVSLWKAIAGRYSTEPVIAGYDLLDNPAPARLPYWLEVSDGLVKAIRSVDQQHLLIVQATRPPKRDFVYLDDPNYMIEFHFLKPYDFTAQAKGNYPDSKIYIPDWSNLTPGDSFDNPHLLSGTTDWREYQGEINPVNSRDTQVGFPGFHCMNLTEGSAYFGNFSIDEYDFEGNFLRQVMAVDLSKQGFWGDYSSDNQGVFELVDDGPDQLPGSKAIKESNIRVDGTASDIRYAFEGIPGHYYVATGWMKGENVNPEAVCTINVQFYTYNKSYDPLIIWDQAHLQRELERLVSYGTYHEVPVLVGEFGVSRNVLQANQGGLHYINDMLDLLDSLQVSYTYRAYNDTQWGVLPSQEQYPNLKPLDNLIQLLQSRMKGR